MRATPVSQKATKAAGSYVSWLHDAGVDLIAQDAPVSWLQAEQPSPQTRQQTLAPTAPQSDAAGQKEPATHATAPSQGRAKPPAAQPSKNVVQKDNWPSSIDQLREMLASGAALPGNHYGGGSAMPVGQAPAKYMLVLDLPERDDISAGKLATGHQGTLIKNMLAALGIGLESVFITALSFTRPATGALPEGDNETLAEFVRHQCGLAKAQQLILLGSSASTALLGAEMMNARGNLHYFNHNGQNVAALTTFHPRTILSRPQMKAQAWKDLQVLKQ